jgi:hypothetical protein
LHWPSQYDIAPLQMTPQLPQFCGSLYVLTHCPLQHVKPIPQAGLQPPPLDAPDDPPLPEPPLALPELEPPPLELPPLLPVASVDASEPPGDVEPPHCDAQIATKPTRPTPRGHFDEMPMVPSSSPYIATLRVPSEGGRSPVWWGR